MSWSLNSVGRKAKVIDEVAKTHYLSAGLKADILDTLQRSPHDAAMVQGNGHNHDGYFTGTVTVQTFQVEQPSPSAQNLTEGAQSGRPR